MGYSNYPQQIDTSTELPATVDLRTLVEAEVVNRLRDAVLAIENELGINPSSTFGTVRARLDDLEAYLEAHTYSPTADNKNMVPNVTAGNFASTGLTLANVPAGDRYVTIIVNGVSNRIGNHTRNRDCYFSRDGGITPLRFSELTTGDTLYWNGTRAGFNLDATDIVDFDYDV